MASAVVVIAIIAVTLVIVLKFSQRPSKCKCMHALRRSKVNKFIREYYRNELAA